MATTLFLRDEVADTHLGTDNANLIPTNVGWFSKALATTRGAGVIASDNTATVTGPTNGVVIVKSGVAVEWISPPLSADVTIAGTITCNIWAEESNMSANVAINAFIEVIRANTTTTRNSNTLVTIAQTARTTELAVGVGARAVNNFTVTPTSTVVNRGDRLRVRIYGDDSAAATMASGFTFDIGYSGTTGAADGDTSVAFTETITFESAPSGTQLFLTDTASDVSTASVDREAWTSRGSGVVNDVTNTAAGWTASLQVTDTAGGTVVDWFTKQLTAFTLTGLAQANIRALESVGTANVSIRCEVARVDSDGTNPTVWSTWCIAPTGTDGGELTTSEVARTANVSGDDLAVSSGQRLRIRLYLDDISFLPMETADTATTFYNGTSAAASGDSYLTLAQSVTEFVSGTLELGPLVELQAVNRSSVY